DRQDRHRRRRRGGTGEGQEALRALDDLRARRAGRHGAHLRLDADHRRNGRGHRRLARAHPRRHGRGRQGGRRALAGRAARRRRLPASEGMRAIMRNVDMADRLSLALTTLLLALVLLVLPALAPARAAVKIQEVTSDGGVTAWLVEDYTVPIVAVRFAFTGGSVQDPAGKEG